MIDKNSQIAPVDRWMRLPNGWSLGAFCIALLVLLPILSVVWIAFNPTENIWPHLISTTLPRYLKNTLYLAFGVAILATFFGTISAWLVTMYRFPGARALQWLLLLPLAIPAYVGAYALVDFLEYAGPVQTALRDIFGWTNARDYWFPEIRSRGAAIIVLAAALFPYVFLLARNGFRDQSAGSYEVARALGAGPVARFWKVGLPLARPAIVAGVAIVMMETVSDFGVVSYFAVQTLTTGIFGVWLEGGNAGGAAQIATVVLLLVLVLVTFEKSGRRKMKFHRASRQMRPLQAQKISGAGAWAALAFCLVPFLVGFVLPFLVILFHALENADRWLDPGLLQAFTNTLFVGAIAAVLTVAAAIFAVYGIRLSHQKLPRMLAPVMSLGYAAPGAVLAIGILFPMSYLDHAIANSAETLFGWNTGLLITGSAFAIIYAYVVRFFAIAQGATDAAFGRVSPSLPMASRSLGQTATGTLRRVYFPLMRGSIGTALLLVFVDCVKELPATLLLRPFNFDTLSTRVYEKASLEEIGNASPAAIMVIAVGLSAVLLLARANRSGGSHGR